jgi:hypothetical protein
MIRLRRRRMARTEWFSRATEGVPLFLKAPADPTAHPFWTPEHAEAGAWSLRDAARLAALHTGLRDSSGGLVEAWSAAITPDEQD